MAEKDSYFEVFVAAAELKISLRKLKTKRIGDLIMSKIKYIEFGFENCETIVIHAKHIRFLSIQDIKQNMMITYNKQTEQTHCKQFAILIKPNGNTYNYNKKKNRMIFDENQSPFERILRHNDITDITLHFEDETTKSIHIPWKDCEYSDENNQYQSSKMKDDGSICILISKKGNVDKFFDRID